MITGKYWQDKISVLLHDPIVKAFDIFGHESIAQELCDIAEVPKERGEEDIIASAFDRIPLPFELDKSSQIKVRKADYFIHPISLEKKEKIYENFNKEVALKTLMEKIKELKEKNLFSENSKDFQKFYHALWWELPEIVNITYLIPADTRVPNHSIIDHLDIAAAVKSTEKEGKIDPALIAFSIPSVQEVISQARKTIDLWAGSYLVSHLIYKAIEYIGLRYGFDNIIYPYLRGNPFVYKTLLEKDIKLNTQPRADEKVASLPNTFLAIVPRDEVDEVIKECRKRVIEEWERIASEALSILKNEIDNPDFINEEEFKKQIELFPTIYSTYIDLPDNAKEVERRIHELFGEDETLKKEITQYKELLEKIKENKGYNENAGNFYKFVFKIISSKMSSSKAIRYFKGYSSDEKVDNKRVPDDFGGGVRACVVLKDKKDEEEVTDYLGALNATKRVLRKILQKNIRYESTEEIARKNKVNEKNTSDRLKNSYIAFLMMDGDNAGKLLSGTFAPKLSEILHDEVRERLKSSEILEKMDLRYLAPSYQRTISRTMGLFSSFVKYVVEDEFDGMLIYSGGDDLLAVLPADKVLLCANKLRKIYSGVGGEKVIIDGDEYLFDNELVWKNGKPYATMMGKNATMSAGITVINHKSPLRIGIEYSKIAIERAKEEIKRNAFSIATVRRSGQMEFVDSKWEYEGLDVIERVYKIYNETEKLKFSLRAFRKILDEDLEVLGKDYIEDIVEYVFEKSGSPSKNKHEFKDLFEVTKAYFKIVANQDGTDINSAIKLILTIEFLNRGENR
ncbi:type III-B CRISPR-associated protein Cas10/Cmr2 [Fervidobacterium sp. 2310opik-2]|uniref:type III-B CRISPR-associated protein Cas10/Cmr2 n=1 Tax=Fervidobacterium sp. 2310opik-2 TaxID=1755815 RepID=UPI0013DFB3E0|nr:type III-B CRISPR-associated protein Cas10/Cmr2 [Fervidobacterium sp. 2310opik-2]KAF2961062.1 hypothetical protein AS161_03545 [Fervidobacterium sp. 2310opik-2]